MPDSLAYGVDFDGFERYLRAQEKAPATIEKYLRDMRAFLTWLDKTGAKPSETNTVERTQETIARWKTHLSDAGFAATSINGKLAALNSYFTFIGRHDLRVRYLKVQRRIFRDSARELTRSDYERLVRQAKKERREMIALVMETICATGIRVSELQFLTIEALHAGRIDITLKGKTRTVFIPKKLKGKLLCIY